jgi:epoxyqueuosine reductase
MSSLESAIKDKAHALGFELAGIAEATPADGIDRMREWLDSGFAGEMDYMHRQADARQHPQSILPGVRSVVMVGMNYKPVDDSNNSAGGIARYARGADYHDVLWERLNQLFAWLQERCPGCRGRRVVDTAPLLERDFARRAGLGWFGKNTMLLNKRLGSYFFIGALLIDLELQPDRPHEASHCGSCTACLDACPTAAFVAPGVLDSRRCISYLTIELRGPIPDELRSGVGEWLFGCDVCQEVCPWNRKSPDGREPAFAARADWEAADPVELLSLSQDQFRRRFRGTALMRTKRCGFLRNAAIVLGNRGDPAALPALQRAIHDSEALIREAAQWAIEQIEKRANKEMAPLEQAGNLESSSASPAQRPFKNLAHD